MLELENITKIFRKKQAFGAVEATVALNDISAVIGGGKTLGVVGESGSGKSTLARIALRMLSADSGRVRFDGEDITTAKGPALLPFRHRVQPVFQDGAGALDPLMSVHTILSEPLLLRGKLARTEFTDRIVEVLTSVDLHEDFLPRLPRELSGGQRQRVGIARALLMEPEIIILDEPVSALDVSVQAQVLNLLRDLQARLGLSYMFIGHDLSIAEYFCDEIIVLRHGELVERGAADQLFRNPQSEYTKRLLDAVPSSMQL